MESIGPKARLTHWFSAPMNEIVPSDVLQRLDERHELLLAELDSLNERLELALKPFAKPVSDPIASTAESHP